MGAALQRELPRGRFRAALAAIVLLVAAAYAAGFGSFDGFVRALGHCPEPFCDFVDHYFPMGQRVFRGNGPVRGFFYPPSFAIALGGLAPLGLEAARALWAAGQVLVWWLVWWLPLRLVGEGRTPLALAHTLVVLTSYPLLVSFKWGQVSVLVTVLVLAAYLLAPSASRARRSASGALLAGAAAIKLYPALFVAPFLVRRDARVVASWLGVAALLLVALPVLVLGWSPTWEFYAEVEARLGRLGDRTGLSSQYLPRLAARLLGEGARVPAQVVNLALLALQLAAGVLVERRRLADRLLWWLVLLSIAVPFATPTAWPHYFVHLAFAPLLLARWALDGTPRSRLVLPALGLSLALSSVACFGVVAALAGGPDRPAWLLVHYHGVVAAANGALLVACHALLWPRLARASIRR